MIFSPRPLLSCGVCGKSINDPTYKKLLDEHGFPHSMYWFNPRLSDLHDQVVSFCGPECSLRWFQEAKARKA